MYQLPGRPGGDFGRIERARMFERVRAMPYATDGAHTAADLLAMGCGDCLAKSALLLELFHRAGYSARRVRWLYLLPDQPAEVRHLPSREDVHSAVEVRVEGRWVLADPTHDPALAAAGLTVAEWDGTTDTAPAFEPAGAIWRPGDGPEPQPNAGTPIDPVVGGQYRMAFNRWLREARGG